MPAIIITRATQNSTSIQGGGTHKEYRVELEERRRRTVYVSSDVPPEQWETQHILNIADISEEQSEGDVYQKDSEDSNDEAGRNSAPVHRNGKSGMPSSRYQSRRASLRPDDATGATAAAAAALKRMSVAPTTPPNSPAVWKSHNPMATKPSANAAAATSTAIARRQVLFYHRHNPHYGFTNFSPHPVMYRGKKYPTSEHLFQSFKFQGHRPDIAEYIRTCGPRPSVAFSEARRYQASVRPDWKSINVEKMDETIYHKFTQHPELMQELLDTGNAELIEDSDKDSFWGIGADGRGRNELGKALERLRAQFRGD
jgi:ribA/ribD-fused uncharacterized protein